MSQGPQERGPYTTALPPRCVHCGLDIMESVRLWVGGKLEQPSGYVHSWCQQQYSAGHSK